MRIGFEKRGRTLYARLVGELDEYCAAELRSRIDEEIRGAGALSTLVLDLSGVSFMDSSGIGVVLGRYRLMRSLGGEIAIVGASPRVESLMRMSGVYTLIEKTAGGGAR